MIRLFAHITDVPHEETFSGWKTAIIALILIGIIVIAMSFMKNKDGK